ncbi:hypothetical protein E4U43_006332 [Claviceps pusilla]|uniref:Uncharacterized protein n=1 Tax=Claviceps pusilla TaxID=123648 RepID=A0A9P7NG91_9HYPO|nr:hypothetical protein E4U43_006332 [Claviceps pusilla]
MGTPSNASEGLADIFCVTDPYRHDNPIVFMFEEFNRTTQYRVNYIIDRNVLALQQLISDLDSARLMHCMTIEESYDSSSDLKWMYGIGYDLLRLGALKKIVAEDERAEAGQPRPTQAKDEWATQDLARRSSETLGDRPSSTSGRTDDRSVTKAIQSSTLSPHEHPSSLR